MIAYVTIGTNNLSRAATFFDQLFGSINIKRGMEEPGKWVSWSRAPGEPGLGVTLPFDGNTATPGNGNMVALAMQDKDQVQAVYAKALALGGKDEGAPGPRGNAGSGFYCAYFRDLDGNKFNAFCMDGQH